MFSSGVLVQRIASPDVRRQFAAERRKGKSVVASVENEQLFVVEITQILNRQWDERNR